MNALPPGFSIVVPVYNGAPGLPELVARIEGVFTQRQAAFEIIMVIDGSPDDSWQVVGKLATGNPRIRGINLSRNYGQHNALLCGVRAARYAIIVTLDDDLQHPPEEIPRLLEKMGDTFDVVYGTPAEDPRGFFRNASSFITKCALQTAMGAETARRVSAFRVFRTQLRDAFVQYRSPWASLDALLTWGTTRFTWLAVRHDPRKFGESNYTFWKLLVHAANMMTGFSTIPLQLASGIGFFITLFGVGVLIYVIARYFWEGTSVPGFPFLASIIAIFSGAQLFALGIIGEYLARMHSRLMDRPSYVIREETRNQG
jgi:undecaprenyl-phosphate 4-deoxy-4-formamido-L-arabinose transferase